MWCYSIYLTLKVVKTQSETIYINATGKSNGRDTETVLLQHSQNLPRLVPCFESWPLSDNLNVFKCYCNCQNNCLNPCILQCNQMQGI